MPAVLNVAQIGNRSPRARKWLGETSPIWRANIDEWRRNELLMLGGPKVVEEKLITFPWELEEGPHFRGRKETAVYTNFPARFAAIMNGHLFRQAPRIGATLDFGALGKVSRKRPSATPTPAELLYYNADGVGQDGSQWDPWWMGTNRMAMATGHRWVYLEGPPEAPQNRADEIRGMRPFLTDFSPTVVTNHEYERGRLAFAVIQRAGRRPRLSRNGLRGNDLSTEFLVLVRDGYDGLGAEFRNGGWWIFNEHGERVSSEEGWEATEGEIPMAPLYYERVRPSEDITAMSRPATSEIGSAAVLDMNLRSAADWDLWDSASSVTALAGIDQAGFNLFMDMVKGGNRYAPLPISEDGSIVPKAEDLSTGAIVAQAFDLRIRENTERVLELMLNEVSVAPDASGAARRVQWTDVRAPRLASMASELETTQNFMLWCAERMWGRGDAGSASVEWRRDFDLIDPLAAGGLFFEMERTAGVSSPTLKSRMMVQIAKAINVLGDDAEEQTVLGEYEKSAKDAANAQSQLGALLGGATNGTPRPGPTTAPRGDGRRREGRVGRGPSTNVRGT